MALLKQIFIKQMVFVFKYISSCVEIITCGSSQKTDGSQNAIDNLAI